MSKLNQLRQLLAPPRTSRGTIMEIVGNTAHIATKRGGTSLRIAPGLLLNTGDAVLIQDDMVIGRVKNAADLVVYDL